MRVDARKGVASLRKMPFPRTGAGIAHGNVPRTTQKAEKERKARTGTAILFFKKKTRRRLYVKARYFNKKRRANALCKKAYLYRGNIS